MRYYVRVTRPGTNVRNLIRAFGHADAVELCVRIRRNPEYDAEIVVEV